MFTIQIKYLRTQVETIKMTKEIELSHLNTLICLFLRLNFAYHRPSPSPFEPMSPPCLRK
jgi:hypothetical protein